jgi:hypothetical protein
MNAALLILASFGLLALAGPAMAGRVPDRILGIQLGMRDDDVRHRLSRIGEPVAGRESLKQSWTIRDSCYGYIVVRYDAERRVKWITAFARKDGRRVRYSDVGDPDQASRSGLYSYTWDVRTERGDRYVVVARGSDTDYASSVSLYRPVGPPLPAPNTSSKGLGGPHPRPASTP